MSLRRAPRSRAFVGLATVLVLAACGTSPQRAGDTTRARSAPNASAAPAASATSPPSHAAAATQAPANRATPSGRRTTPAPSPRSELCFYDPSKPPCPPPFAEARRPDAQKIDWATLARWWPYTPRLAVPDTNLARGQQQILIAFGSKDQPGTASDPHTRFTYYALFVQQPPTSDVDEQQLLTFVEAGGKALRVRWHTVDRGPPSQFPTAKTITVRGGPGQLTEMYRDLSREDKKEHPWRGSGNVNLRFVMWNTPAPDGGIIYWEFLDDPTKSSEEATLAYIDAMIDRRG